MPAQPPSSSPADELYEGPAEATDHLIHLPKMSATAGVGTTDYVAINLPSVFALLLGFASIFAIMNEVMLIIPMAAITVGWVALRQINNSNGTQTGRGMVTGGLFLAVLCGSYVLTAYAADAVVQQHDRGAILAVCKDFGDKLGARQFDTAYDLFSQRFKSRVSRPEFVARTTAMQDRLTREGYGDGGLGMVKGAHGTSLLAFHTDPDSGAETAEGFIVLTYANAASENQMGSYFRKSGDTWYIEDIPDLFPPGK
jgi:hypothetical protein